MTETIDRIFCFEHNCRLLCVDSRMTEIVYLLKLLKLSGKMNFARFHLSFTHSDEHVHCTCMCKYVCLYQCISPELIYFAMIEFLYRLNAAADVNFRFFFSFSFGTNTKYLTMECKRAIVYLRKRKNRKTIFFFFFI